MPRTITDLPPDHPIFTGGPHLVFRDGAPPSADEQDDDSQPSEDESE
jgi:hypothetical protein